MATFDVVIKRGTVIGEPRARAPRDAGIPQT